MVTKVFGLLRAPHLDSAWRPVSRLEVCEVWLLDHAGRETKEGLGPQAHRQSLRHSLNEAFGKISLCP